MIALVIGNIEAGKSGSIDILTYAVSTTGSSGEISTVVVAYEDKEGNETELTGKFNIVVESPVYDNVDATASWRYRNDSPCGCCHWNKQHHDNIGI